MNRRDFNSDTRAFVLEEIGTRDAGLLRLSGKVWLIWKYG